MSINAIRWAWQIGESMSLSPTQRFVLLALADHHNDATGACFPSIPTIRRATGHGRTSIIEGLDALESRGVIVREKSSGRSNSYVLQIKPTSPRHGRVNDADQSVGRTGSDAPTSPLGGPDQSVSRTEPVRLTDKTSPSGGPNPKENPKKNHKKNHKNARERASESVNAHEEENEMSKQVTRPGIELPNWVDTQAWIDFKEHRQRLRKPMTPKAESLALRTLCDLTNDPQTAAAIIEQSIECGWQKFFPLKEPSNGHGRRPPQASIGSDERNATQRRIDDLLGTGGQR